MNNLDKAVILTYLVKRLSTHGSWCGETHIQKASYFLEGLAKIPTDHDFILYKHGPYSFDLHELIIELRADGLLESVPNPFPYGPSLATTALGDRVEKAFPKIVEKYQDKLDHVAKLLGKKRVTELERLATALYVTLQEGRSAAQQDRANKILELKPHISPSGSLSAVKKVDTFFE